MHQNESDIRNRLLVARLPAMPQILLKLIEQCQTEEVGISALAELVSKDPGMTGKILAVANSSAYRHNDRKFGLEHSLMTLGVEMIKTLVISESVFQVFNNFSYSNSTNLRVFWKHSLFSAVLAREIAGLMGYPHAEEAYLAGLLHDVGRLALLATAPKEYGFSFLAKDDNNLCQFEERALKITHQEAGAWLVERWNLDSFLSDSVLYHHESTERLGATHPLIRIVLLAHLLSDLGDGNPDVRAAAVLCGIGDDDLARIMLGASSLVDKSAELLGIDLSGIEEPPPPLSCDVSVSPEKPVQEQLSKEVLNLMLISEAGRTFAPQKEENALLETITRSARVLFDLENAAILSMSESGKSLVGVPIGEDSQRLKEFTVALSSGGVVAEVALQRRMAYIVGDGNPLGIAEEQLLRILKSRAFVCIPLVSGHHCLGVLIGGVAAWQIADLKKRERFLRSFGEQAANALETVSGDRGDASRRVASIVEEYKEASRKIIHEVNNPLSIIKNYLSVLDSKLERKEPVSGEISILNDEIDRVGVIIQGLANLKPAIRENGTEVNRVIRDVARLFCGTELVSESVKVTVQPQDMPSEIEADSDTLKQILVNLVKNAIEAIPSGGEVKIVNNGHVNRDGSMYLELCVMDNGPGIPPQILDSLFQPVQSTKGGGHQGLGLNIVHGLVKKNQGLISCRSNDKGTNFEILLPVRKQACQTVSGGVQREATP